MSTKGREAPRRRASGLSVAPHTTLRVVQAGPSDRGPAVAGIEGGAR